METKICRIQFKGDLSDALRFPPELKAWLAQQTYFEEVISRRTPPEGDFFVNQTIQDCKVYARNRKPPYNFGGGVD